MKIVAAVFVMLCFALPVPSHAQGMYPPSSAGPVGESDRVLGNPDAKITIIEYGSVACPPCAAFHDKAMAEFTQQYIDTGQVRYVYRPMMTGNPAVAAAGHLLAACAGEDRYFSVIDEIMRSQSEMGSGGPQEAYSLSLIHI